MATRKPVTHSLPTVSGYTLLEQIYSNVTTGVYRARQQNSDRTVIIKLLQQTHPSFDELVKFRNQYSITQDLAIPGVVRSLSLEPWQNSYALIMEDCGGLSLQTYAQQRRRNNQPLSLIEVLGIGIQTTDILQGLAQHGLVHKDIKPANLLIHPDSRRMSLIDFSISSRLPKETQTLQPPNQLEGTLLYLAPEQTGRMNRAVDYRTDFYALGVTLYELLTGQVPFQSTDPLTLVHAHIAKQPTPPEQLNPEIPAMVSAVVLKLMAKNAEDRYQSAPGLKHDLEQCLHQWKEQQNIEAFELGKRDISDRFLIPEKLYGRESEIESLLSAFNRTASGQTQMMLVAGFSGVGKTAVISEVHKPITQQQGYFSSGKFDQFNRDIPFSGFVQAFKGLIEQLLGESDRAIAHWKATITQALGDSAQVIVNVLPELEHIIGRQPAVAPLSGTAAKTRFNRLLTQFVSALVSAEHPLVLFLDDLQWADSSSLQLLERLMADAPGHLLILGAYRDNEVFPAHPLMLTLEKIANSVKPDDPQAENSALQTMTLSPLSEDAINHICADTLGCDLAAATPLSQSVYQKAAGNPFFTTQFLQGLHQENYIAFDAEMGHWQCDLTQIKQRSLTENVVDFMVNRLKKLPEQTQQALQRAACIGNQFDLETLAIVCQQDQSDVASQLWTALQDGFVLPVNETYKFFQESTPSLTSDDQQSHTVTYRFLHDRVQQAAYALIPDPQKASFHYQIGQRLNQQLEPITTGERLFEVVTQLNHSAQLIDNDAERELLIQLNLLACKKARAATAYPAVRQYADTGLILLKENWRQHYSLMLSFHNLAAESAALEGELAKMEQLAQRVIAHSQTILDQIDIQLVRIQANIAHKNLNEAIAIGRYVLQQLGLDFPPQPTPAHSLQAIIELKEIISDRPIHSFVDLPPMSDPQTIAAVKVTSSLISAAFMSASPLYPLLVISGVKLSLQHGNIPASALAYVSYSVLACNYFQAVDVGVQFAQLAFSLVEKLDDLEAKASVFMTGSLFSIHRNTHLKDTLPYFQQGFTTAIEAGTMEFAGYCAGSLGMTSFLSGLPLAPLEKETRAYCQSFMQLNHPALADYCRNHWQTILNLTEKTDQPHILSGEALQEDHLLPVLKETQALSGLFFTYGYKLVLAYLFEETAAAMDYAAQMRDSLMGGMGSALEPVFYFYDSLSALAQYRIEPEDSLLQQVEKNQTVLQQQWAQHAPMNYQHKLALIEAEKCQVLEQYANAITHYDEAIALAHSNGFMHEEALANELAAKFYLCWGNPGVAQRYMKAAYYGYSHWGAKNKTIQLEQRYPQLLAAVLETAKPTLTRPNAAVSHTVMASTVMATDDPDSGPKDSWLDFPAVLKAAQAISQEIELEALLSTLMQIVVADAGAQTGYLLLKATDQSTEPGTNPVTDPAAGQWHLVAQADCDATHTLNTPLSQCTLPQSLIHTVIRTQQLSVYDNLSTEPKYQNESYLLSHQPHSVLCLPIIHQGNLVGVLYMENNLTVGAFTSDRIELLQLLTSQAAISIENARLHQQTVNYSQTLEAEVAKKTQALGQKATDLEQALASLQQTQAKLIHTEKMSSLGQMVAGVAHEINNPATFIKGNVGHARDYIQDLLQLVELYQSQYPQKNDAIQALREDIDLDFVVEDLESVLTSIYTGSDRIQTIVQNLRAFSHLDESGKKAIDINKGIESTLGVLNSRLQIDNQDIQIVKDYGELPPVDCYPSQINQVFLHILSNAIDAMTAEGCKQPSIHISTAVTDNKQIRIDIRNNGPAIPEDIQQRIFDPFFTTKEVGSGTGLGLFISYSIVQQHLGTLSVESPTEKSLTEKSPTERENTLFTICLPAT